MGLHLAQSIASRRKHEAAARRAGQARQAAKIKELGKVLLALGYKTWSQKAAVLGLNRSTVWAMFKSDHTHGGLSSDTVKQLLAAKGAPKEGSETRNSAIREREIGWGLWS
jgi:hypothetical protein